MFQDFTIFLWLLKLGALVNLYFLANTVVPPGNAVDPHLLVPAQILFAVSAFRCLFPNQYKGNVVFHDTPLSSIFLTRLLATSRRSPSSTSSPTCSACSTATASDGWMLSPG